MSNDYLAVVIAVVALLAGVISPSILAFMQARQAAAERYEARRREYGRYLQSKLDKLIEASAQAPFEPVKYQESIKLIISLNDNHASRLIDDLDSDRNIRGTFEINNAIMRLAARIEEEMQRD